MIINKEIATTGWLIIYNNKINIQICCLTHIFYISNYLHINKALMSQAEQANIQSHILARFTILKKIGSGAYGHVWKVEDKITKKIYALKKIFDAFQHSTDAQRTYREIQILKQIEHPNIIRLYESIKAQNNKDVYLVFQFMEADLHNVIAEGILKEVHIRFIVYQLAKALKYLHSGSIIHRDLKPSNILINSNCIIKLCDFGLVRSIQTVDENIISLTEGVATRWYRAPQVLLGSTKYSTPADIWSFGCIIYEILAQKPMFPGQNTTDQIQKILNYSGYPTQDQLKSLKSESARNLLKESKIPYYTPSNTSILKDLPSVLGELIKKMTTFNPSQRITVEQILNHEAVQAFRKKQEEIQCNKIISMQVNDNKKLSVDEYRCLIYGTKRPFSSDASQRYLLSKKSGLFTQYNSNFEEKQKQKQKQPYATLKYVRSKQLLKTVSNKSVQISNMDYNNYQEKKEDKTAQSRNDILKDPTRMAYISKNFYSSKYLDTSKPISNLTTFTPSSTSSYIHSQSYQNLTQNPSSYSTLNMNTSGFSNNFNKAGSSYTASSAYSNQRKPVLFKSSKYVITGASNGNRLSENNKD